jgi:hypothetical protein
VKTRPNSSAALSVRTPKLPAAAASSQEPREGHITAREDADKGAAPPEQQELSQRRSWLHRFFLGP